MHHQFAPIGNRLVDHHQGADRAQAGLLSQWGRRAPAQRGVVACLQDQAVNGPAGEVVLAEQLVEGDSALAALQIEVGSRLRALDPVAGVGFAWARFKTAACLPRARFNTGIGANGSLVAEIVQGHGLRL